MLNNLHLPLLCALIFSFVGTANPAKASEPMSKVLAENEKLQVLDVVDRPGDVSPAIVRQGRVVHWITGGKLERTYADGSKEVLTRKGGETTLITEKRPYSVKNIGTTSVHLIEVELK